MTNQENRSTILEYIFRNAPVARSTIAKQTQITPATVTSISGNFIQEECESFGTRRLTGIFYKFIIDSSKAIGYSIH